MYACLLRIAKEMIFIYHCFVFYTFVSLITFSLEGVGAPPNSYSNLGYTAKLVVFFPKQVKEIKHHACLLACLLRIAKEMIFIYLCLFSILFASLISFSFGRCVS